MTSPPTFSAILVAAGQSSRMGFDKLWVDIWGRPAWRWSLDALLSTPGLHDVAIAVPTGAEEQFRALVVPSAADRCIVVSGGQTRADSVIAGLWALVGRGADDHTLILVHDAARPAVTTEVIFRVAEAASAGDVAVVPVVPVVDSLKRVRNERVVGTVDRDEIVAAQTPQAARLEALRSSIEEAHAWGRPITDDSGALAASGTPVHTVRGDPENRKLTDPSDIDVIRALLARRASPLATGPRSLGGGAARRAGIGFDAHRLVVGREMRIAGVAFPDEPVGPEGHSDGDAALHALIDALLGAAAIGDVGAMFPPDDPGWAGADSADLVVRAVALLAAAGWVPASVDIAVAVTRPALAPRRDELAARVAGLLGIEAGLVSVKGTTTDGLGIAGEGGIAAWASATVERGQ